MRNVQRKTYYLIDYGLKHPKMTTADVEGEVVSALVLKPGYPFPKNQKCLCIPSHCLVLFSRSVLLFPRSDFLLNVCVFQDCFFQVIVLSICSAKSCSERWYLPWSLNLCHGVWFLMYFIQVLVSMIVYKMKFSEHLEWLKLIDWNNLVPFFNVSDPALFF